MSDETMSDDELISYLRAVKLACEEGLENLGADPDDDVSGFAFGDFKLAAPRLQPQQIQKLGPRFGSEPSSLKLGGGGEELTNGSCNFIC